MEAETKVRFLEKDYDVETRTASFTINGAEEISVSLDEFPQGIVTQLALHGLLQKAGDATAGCKGDAAAASEAIRTVLDNLRQGRWGAVRESEGKPRVAELALAIARVTGMDVASVSQRVSTASDEQRKAWREFPEVAAAIAQIRAEKAAERAKAASGQFRF